MASLCSPALRAPLRTPLSKPLRINNFLPLPPHIRSRAFHATTPRPIYNETIQATHYLLTSLHSLSHTPWALTLPLVALLLRGAIILPIALKQRAATKQQIELAPVLQAWRHTLTAQAQKDVGHLGPGYVQRQVMVDMRKKRKEIYARYNCGMWKSFLGLAQLPFFLGVMETLRVMVGTREGWLGIMKNFWSSSPRTETGANAVITGDGLTSNLDIPVETSMATEGILWFPNLLVADPQLVLPFVLSGTILLNIFGGPSVGPLGKWQTRIKRGMGATALFIGPAMMGFPSALLVYWTSSSFFNWVQMWLLNWWDPIKKPVKFLVPKRPWKTGLGTREIFGKA